MELRPVRPDERPAVRDLHQRSFDHDGVPEVLSLEEVEEELDDGHVVLETDTRVAVVDGVIVGTCWAYHLPSDVKEERCYLNGEVEPAFRGNGVGRELLAWGIDRAAELLQSSGSELPKFIRVDAFEFIEDAHRLYRRMGFEPIRYMDELLRPLTNLPASREVDGIRIVPWPADRDEEIRLEKNAAFADHWGSTPTSPKHWEQAVHGYGSRLDLSFIAVDDHDRVVGHCLNRRYPEDDELIGRSDAWIDSLGTLAEWRGRGIASAMIIRSLRAFAADGLTHASIGVDSANPTGAAELYRSLGFNRHQRSITHQIQI